MNKILKKISAVALSACIAASLCVTALAATTASTDTGTITVNDLAEGVTASAYQIAHATYDGNDNVLGYAMNVTGTNFVINSDGSYDKDALTEENLAELFTALNGASATASATAGSDGIATIENLPVGAYLVVISGSESVSYGMMIGSVYYADADGEWTIVSGEITDVTDCELWTKSITPTILKEETGGSLTDDDYEHGGSADVGDTIEYHITVANIPSYQGEYPEFYVTDEISSELTITNDELDALTVTVDDKTLTKGTDYTVERTANGFTVDFVVNDAYTLNAYAGQSLVIDFCADVTGAQVEADDHLNDATLTYATTSYVMNGGDHYEGTDTDEDHEYTFAMKATKIDKDNAPLSDAVFTLFTEYTSETENTPYTQNGQTVTATSDEEGVFTFTGLQEGTYYLAETTAPAGYALNTEVYTVEISANYTAVESKEGGQLESYTITITDSTGIQVAQVTSSVETGLTVVNTKLGILPSMGGTGTALFMIGGALVIAIAVAGIVVYRKRVAA